MLFLALTLLIIGLIIGLGAVVVIDLHGFLGRTSSYWTVATTRTHRVTKPLIWIGTAFYALGLVLMYGNALLSEPLHIIQLIALIILILNGCFLTFVVSPFLLARERLGTDAELLPQTLQIKIAVSFIVSVLGWWGSVALLVIDLTSRLQ